MEGKTVDANPKAHKGGNTFDVVDKLRQARRAVVEKLATVPDPALVSRCEAMLIGFDELLWSIRNLAPQVEQLKGMVKGLHVACPMVLHHIQLLRDKYPDPEQSDLLTLSKAVVVDCHGTIEGAWRKQREEMVQAMGRFDGGVNGALAIVRRIEQMVSNYERLLEEEKELAADPFADAEPGDNGAQQPKKQRTKPRKGVRKVKTKEPRAN